MSNPSTTRPPQSPFERIADFMSVAVGNPIAFALAISIVILWALTGPFTGFSTTWQLIINTGTPIVTCLMVFLLGNASNRITENQDRMLQGIYNEEKRLDAEEKLIERVIERIDSRHIQPILKHLDEQDKQVELIVRRILDVVSRPEPPAAS
ncbi:MAG: low affinity iron permease family protein [Dehalococcoidia bacterium]